MSARPPEPPPADDVVYLVWIVRLAALLLVPPALGLALGLAVRIFRVVAGVE